MRWQKCKKAITLAGGAMALARSVTDARNALNDLPPPHPRAIRSGTPALQLHRGAGGNDRARSRLPGTPVGNNYESEAHDWVGFAETEEGEE